jgi:predicted MPP superfamily phosphohydrolase
MHYAACSKNLESISGGSDMPDSVILRFRDRDGIDTIRQHRAVITGAGYVWWGWWKKLDEADRTSELAQLQAHARAKSIEIGLFDRNRRYFSAKVLDCIYGSSPIFSPDAARTPQYYATERVAAWFKLQSIEGMTEADFLKRYLGLPVGDGTFFPVWNGEAPSSARPVTPLRVRSERILHLSDLHLGHDYGFSEKGGPGKAELIDTITRDLRDHPPGLVVVSGDITSRADATVLQSAGVTFLATLADRLAVPREHFVIVPGNHDIALNQFTAYDYSHEKPFLHFMQDFYGGKIDFPGVRRFLFPSGRGLDVLCMNSVRLRDKKESNYGYVDWNLYSDLLRLQPTDPTNLRLAVMHHHLVQAPRVVTIDSDYPDGSVSTTLDAANVIEGLQQSGFDLVLHGHQHVPAISRVSRAVSANGSPDVTFTKDLHILAAGSAGSARLGNEMKHNSYNVLDIVPDGIEVECRIYNQEVAPRSYFKCKLPGVSSVQ